MKKVFEHKDFEDIAKYCDNALEHLGKFSMPVGSRLYSIYRLFRLIKKYAEFSK